MKKPYRSLILAIAATALSAGIVFNLSAQPGAYVEIRTYRDTGGTVQGVRYISHGCADPQPAGWGRAIGLYTSQQSMCFALPTPGGGL
ncbi:hypothetical protein AZ78_3737 [Lysobacter capsici AZ78]|jgi:hypothetical protein|uniref:Uncharacterized protein n=1 Tax=Lysobacter capsici AZ78 TaxID=1444315 RepID=A0A125MND1_9GAMM|nr:hypothetical protein [Lysobacter capsici]KWS06183.1 hypothetical protein AZ78_3737 [Lysobacter capsici AZ78]